MLFYQKAVESLYTIPDFVRGWRPQSSYHFHGPGLKDVFDHMHVLGALLREEHMLTSSQQQDMRRQMGLLPVGRLWRYEEPPPFRVWRGLKEPRYDLELLDMAECVLICYQEKEPLSYLVKLWDSVSEIQADVRNNPLKYAATSQERDNQIDRNHPNLLIRYSGLKFQWIKDAIAANQEA